MKNKTITTQKIADELGISRNTISSVLNGKARERRISEKTVKRVMDYVKATSFHQDLSALSMRGKYSKDVALITSSFIYPHLRRLYFHLMDNLNRQGLSFVNLFFSPENIGELLQQIKFYKFSKIVFIAYDLKYENNFRVWKQAREKLNNCEIFYYDFPYEACDLADLEENESAVGVDRLEIRHQTLKLLKNKGYRKVIKRDIKGEDRLPVVSGLKLESYNDKLKFFHKGHLETFYEDSLFRTGLLLAESYCDYDFRETRTAFHLYDSFVCSGFMCGMKKNNLQIPKDLGLILSWGDSETKYLTGTTAWQFPHFKMFKLLENWLNNPEEIVRQKFEAELIEGDTI